MPSKIRFVRSLIGIANVICSVMFCIIEFSSSNHRHEARPWIIGTIFFSGTNVVLMTVENRHVSKQGV
jgi:hypothetical protein